MPDLSRSAPPPLPEQVIRVLFIEDDEDDFVLTGDLLRSIEGVRFEVDWVNNYDAGLSAVGTRVHDVCLVDYRLDARTGVELVREAIAQGCVAPIIVLTGQGGREVDLAAMDAGAADFLNKAQITAPLLERSIRYSIQQRRSEEQRIELVRAQTARREAEAANAAKDQFLATLSHELRTPLNAILGWTQLLRMPELDEDSRTEAVDAVERNAKAQAQLIDDLLDMSRIISGNIRIDLQPVVLPQVINAAIDSVRPAMAVKRIELVRRIDESVGVLRGDATRLQQVIWNLLTNAVKFTPEGGRVMVRLARDGEQAALEVTDNGQGIEPEFLPYIFERFRQADSSTTRAQTGLGLGLAIVRHLVSMHDGTVEAHSDGPGTGSTFRIRLPLIQDPIGQARLPTAESSISISTGTLRGLRVLLVDDERDTRTVLAKTLRWHGAEVIPADSAAEGFELFRQNPPDFLISDLAMPGEDGYSLMRRIRAHEQTAGERAPAIALSAYTSEQDRQNALSAGFDAHLSKPIDSIDLVTAVARLAGLSATVS